MVNNCSEHIAAAATGWAFSDAVVHFWDVRTGEAFPVPAKVDQEPIVMGRSSHCDICLPFDTCSRRHAELRRDQGVLTVADLNSSYGLLVNDVRCERAVLHPGDELRLGELTLVAESPRVADVRRYLAYHLGYSAAANEAVGRALRALRSSATRRSLLEVRGVGDLPAFVAGLHGLILGSARPFVCATPGETDPIGELERAWPRAAGGTLCIRHLREYGPLENVLAQFIQPSATTQLILVSPDCYLFLDKPVHTIIVPSCLERWREIDQVIEEAATRVCGALEIHADWWSPADTRWVKERDVRSVSIIEEQVRRIACNRFGIDPSPKPQSVLRRATGSLLRFITNAPHR